MDENTQSDANSVPSYELMDSTRNYDPKVEGNDNIYRYHLNGEMHVEEGYVVGVQQPLDSQLLLVLRGQGSSIVTGFNSSRSINPSPMMRPLPMLRPIFQASSESKLIYSIPVY